MIAPAVTLLFNLSLKLGRVSSDWKSSHIIGVFGFGGLKPWNGMVEWTGLERVLKKVEPGDEAKPSQAKHLRFV